MEDPIDGEVVVPIRRSALWWWIATALNASAFAMGFRLNWYPSNDAFVETVFAVTALFFVVAIFRGRFRLTFDRGSPRLSLAWGFHLLLLMIGMHVLGDQTLLDRSAFILPGAFIGCLLTSIVVLADRPAKWSAIPLSLLLLSFAGWAGIHVANYRLDASSGTAKGAVIDDKTLFTRRSGAVDYTLDISGPASYPRSLAVQRNLYQDVNKDDHLCLTEHQGRFGGRWFRYAGCGPTRAEPPKPAD